MRRCQRQGVARLAWVGRSDCLWRPGLAVVDANLHLAGSRLRWDQGDRFTAADQFPEDLSYSTSVPRDVARGRRSSGYSGRPGLRRRWRSDIRVAG